MKISTRSRYGLRLLLDLAQEHGKGHVFLRDIAARQEISEKYLGQIIIPLRTAGLVKSQRGAHGGYFLARPPEEINLLEIVTLLEGDLGLVECVNEPSSCNRSSLCVTQEVWCRVSQAITDTLKGMNLAQLVERLRSREGKSISYAI